MLRGLLSMYRPRFAKALIYMLQTNEYQIKPYLSWFWQTTNFNEVMHRKTLVVTGPAKLLLASLRLGMIVQIVVAVLVGLAEINGGHFPWFGLAILLATPLLWAHLVVLPLWAGRLLIVGPRSRRQIRQTKQTFGSHPAVRIAVAGSYGKTTMKEVLATVLGEAKKVAATPANKNVSSEHAKFALRLNGDEEVLIIEYGEGEPGDIDRFVQHTHPTVGVVTGLAPAHLDKYKSLHDVARDFSKLAEYLRDENVFANGESAALKPYLKSKFHIYDQNGVLGWKVSNTKVSIEGLSFEMTKGKDQLKLHSGLLGRHQLGPLALAAALANKLGLSKAQIEAGVAKTASFEHRMKPRQLSGAWVIDDTYNGNIDGMKAGLELLAELPAKRKIYVTPGLVDQGGRSAQIHHVLGQMIAKIQPDQVVLMENSVMNWIKAGLTEGGYRGDVITASDPLEFYNNLEHLVAAGDLVLMQNDWPDNYK